MIDLLAKLHARWAATTALNNLLDSSRLFTDANQSAEPSLPFAIVVADAGTIEARTNAGEMESIPVRFAVYDDDLDDARAIAAAVLDAFDAVEFDLAGADKVRNMRRTGQPGATQDDETGVWVVTVNFETMVWIERAA